ncbi:aminotransferase class I/II-fold pyridoxal phosphate-dependent enzyme [bacterium]|nr:aminotransferase class I/II-fold pyridoxal phosphate-dependent enzyme [bacterium]
MNKELFKNIESERIRYLPTYIFQEINDRKTILIKEGKDIIDLSMGNPDMPAPKPVIEKLIEATSDKEAHRYSVSKGIMALRKGVCEWYEKRFGVVLDAQEESIVCIGSKEGVNHLALAIFNHNDTVMVPNPTYPSHFYSVAIAGAKIYDMPLTKENNFTPTLPENFLGSEKPKAIVIGFPSNPTTQIADIGFFERVVKFAKKNNIIVIHDNAYAELGFDGYKAPSFLQTEGAKEVGIEFYSLSKTYNMAGWRVGFAVGNKYIIKALARLKSYYDYGMFAPIQEAGVAALSLDQKYIDETVGTYQRRRDILVEGLNKIGWKVQKPKATMYLWAEIPDKFKEMGSKEFSLYLMDKAGVAVSPGIGFGKYGEGYLRIALVANEERIRQSICSIEKIM